MLIITVGLSALRDTRKAIAASSMLGIGILFNPLLTAFVPFFLVLLRKRIVFVLLLLAVLSPWAIRNSLKYDKFIPVYNKNAYKISTRYYTDVSDGWETVSALYHNAALLTSKGWDNKAMPAISKRNWNTFHVLTYAYIPVMMLGLIGLIKYHKKEHRMIYMPIVCYTLLYVSLSIFRISYRLYAETLFIIYCSVLIGRIIHTPFRRRMKGAEDNG
jgi:hypothetical protein